ncbi:MAG: hypothetical protein QE485_02060 [Acidovorax sp.]|uniref:hypothetical protein n=1 Tax=Acidovorax sp. TaxID=1872122 RepID=UPI0026327274|nr:hypothetical protein [Acidovorax sp.]MDH4415986.1 hypothetical protein [Acidovorax sp.]
MINAAKNLPTLLLVFSTILALTACGSGGDSETRPAPELSKDLCFDNSIYAANASYKLSFKEGATSPIVSGFVRTTSASFNGVSDLVQFVETTNNTITTVVTRYLKPSAPQITSGKPLPTTGLVFLYGTEAAQGATSFTTTTYTPAYEDRRAELAVGETRMFVGQGTRTQLFPPKSDPYTRREQVKFVGVELITMPAGTFTSCRYEIDDATTEWWHRGLVIRREIQNGEPRILQSGELNGAPLKSQ